MAITTVNEKLQLLGETCPISADGLGQDDLQQLLGEYPGILWGAGKPVQILYFIFYLLTGFECVEPDYSLSYLYSLITGIECIEPDTFDYIFSPRVEVGI